MFIDKVAFPDMDDEGMEMNEFVGLPSMGDALDYNSDPLMMYFEEEEEEAPLIDCDIPLENAAVDFYARAGAAPAHLPIVNYEEFTVNTAVQVGYAYMLPL